MRRSFVATVCPFLLLLCSCGELRQDDRDLVRLPAVTYLDHVEPLLSERCTSCHQGEDAPADYRLDSWRGLFGRGKDNTPNVIAGEKASRLLTIFEGHDHHPALLSPQEREALRGWVVDEELAYFSVDAARQHALGWMNPSVRGAASFHGGFLRLKGWDMRSCQSCHGEDFGGGRTGLACKSCHLGGPTGCSTCHGDGTRGTAYPPGDLSGYAQSSAPGVGVHALHLEATQGMPVACSECHLVPSGFSYAAGHLFDSDDRKSDLRAEVVFGPLARGELSGLSLAPTYDKTTRRCSDVYCHALGGARVESWPWNEDQGEVRCDACHGYPPQTTRAGAPHKNVTACEGCHLGAYRDGQLDPATHINGQVELF